MCLVEIEKQRSLQPACTFPVTEGMVVQTDSPKVTAAREVRAGAALLRAHPLLHVLPVSGSEESTDCELQRLAYSYGLTHWEFAPNYAKKLAGGRLAQVLRDGPQPLHPLPALHPRLRRDRGQPHAGRAGSRRAHHDHRRRRRAVRRVHLRLLRHLPAGLPDRRADRPPQRLHGRPRRCTTHTQATCMGCAVGCGIEAVTRDNKLLRVEGDWDAANGGLLCVHGRFEVVEPQPKRVTTPLVRKDDELGRSHLGRGPDRGRQPPASRRSRGRPGLAAGHQRGAWRLPAALRSGARRRSRPALRRDAAAEARRGRQRCADLATADCIVVVGGDPLEDQKVVGYTVQARGRQRRAA